MSDKPVTIEHHVTCVVCKKEMVYEVTIVPNKEEARKLCTCDCGFSFIVIVRATEPN